MSQNATEADGYRDLRWNEEEGPLARSDEHLSLPLPQTTFTRRQAIVGRKDVLAAFDDGSPFLVRQTLGKGEIFFCSVLPEPDWSSLGEGPVLVPMLQRLLLAGGRRLQQVSSVACGEMNATDSAQQWVSVDSTTSKDIRSQAGIYRAGERLIAVNRPAAEDDPEMLDSEQTRKLFGDLPTQIWQDHAVGLGRLQGEIWRLFAFAMLLLLIAEGILILPATAAPLPHPNSPGFPDPLTARSNRHEPYRLGRASVGAYPSRVALGRSGLVMLRQLAALAPIAAPPRGWKPCGLVLITLLAVTLLRPEYVEHLQRASCRKSPFSPTPQIA